MKRLLAILAIVVPLAVVAIQTDANSVSQVSPAPYGSGAESIAGKETSSDVTPPDGGNDKALSGAGADVPSTGRNRADAETDSDQEPYFASLRQGNPVTDSLPRYVSNEDEEEEDEPEEEDEEDEAEEEGEDEDEGTGVDRIWDAPKLG